MKINTIARDVRIEAQRLYSSGFNIFPIQFGSKQPYGPHGLMATTRVHAAYLDDLFADSNIAVMMGRLSGNLVAIDCDDDDSYEFVGSHLRQRGIRSWVRLGARGGQFWQLCAEGEVENRSFGPLQVLGHNVYSVAPPSVHPEGVFYSWGEREGDLPPIVSIRQLDFLGLTLANVKQPRSKRDKTTLPPAAHRVLVEGDTHGYSSHSEAEFAACLSMLQAGFPDEVIRIVFAEFAPPHYAKSSGRSFDKWTLAPAYEWLKTAEATKKQVEYLHSSHFINYAETRSWPGRTGNTDRAVYLALCERMCKDRGARIFRASVRELAEIANVGTQAVQSALKRLRNAGLTKHENKDEATGACLHSLIPQAITPLISTVGIAYTLVGDSVVTTAMQDDAFHIHALGKSALAVWRLLLAQEKPMTANELSAKTGRARSTIMHNAAKLEAVGLVKREGTNPCRWVGQPATQEDLNTISITLGTQGKAATRKARHIEERQKRASHLLLKQKQIHRSKC